MKYIGPHVSAAGGVHNAPANANALGATGFALFTKNQRQWKAKPLEPGIIDAFHKNMELGGYDARTVLAHNSYLINIGHPEKENRNKSIDALIDETQRCATLGIALLNIHPGSGLGTASANDCLSVIAESVNIVLDKTNGVTIVLETTAGQGGYVGSRFEELACIISQVEDKSRIGVCIDTCHIFAAGYDIRDAKSYDETMREFGRVVGFEYIRGLHLNDSKGALGKHADRHESLGKGQLGMETFRLIMKDKRFEGIPCILETPDESVWLDEIKMLKNLL